MCFVRVESLLNVTVLLEYKYVGSTDNAMFDPYATGMDNQHKYNYCSIAI